MKIGLIGYGYWGGGFVARNIARVADLSVIVDPNPHNLVKASAAWGPWGTRTASEPEVAFRECDAVWIATPARTHFQLCAEALEAGCHVMCEKPFVMDPQEAYELVNLAIQKDLALQVGFTALYMSSHRKARRLSVLKGTRSITGDIEARSIRRTSLPSESDVNVLWGLGPHDIAAVIDLFGEPIDAEWSGNNHRVNGVLRFEDRCSAYLEFDWLSKERYREFVVGDTDVVETTDHFEPLLQEAAAFVDLCGDEQGAERQEARLLATRVTEALSVAARMLSEGVAA